MVTDLLTHVVSQPNVMAGAPTIRGTRITVSAILGQLAAGSSFEELLQDYPSLAQDDIRAALAFAAQMLPAERERIVA